MTMKKAVKGDNQPERTLTLAEYLPEIKRVESRAGFKSLMVSEKDTASRTQGAWEKHFASFMGRPTGTPWSAWLKTQGGK
jgi:hypothetical protein